MRRAIARGRVFPQSYSTDRRIGRLSLKAWGLFSLMWVNGDDQGRLSGDPEEVKYSCCPNIDHITKADIPELLKELEQNKLIKVYATPKSAATQMLDWWDVNQKMQWAYPSDYPPPDGWQDRLRYKKGREQVITLNWDSPEHSGGGPTADTGEHPPEHQTLDTGEHSGEQQLQRERTKENPEKEEELEEETRRGKRRAPEHSGESPSLADSQNRLLNDLSQAYRRKWGLLKASDLETVIPREPDPRTNAQLRDLSKELSQYNCPSTYIYRAFDEAAAAKKYKIPYVRAILLDWLGVERNGP